MQTWLKSKRCFVAQLIFCLSLVGCATGIPLSSVTPTSAGETRNLPPPTPPSTLSELITALASNNDEARIVAARTLGERGKAAELAVPALARNLYYDGPYEVREAAAEALGKIGPTAKQAVPLLNAILLSDFVHVRRAAARALGEIGDPSAVPGLAFALFLSKDDDRNWGTASIAAESLEKLTRRSFGSSSIDRSTIDTDGIPGIVNLARDWWKREGQHQNWLQP